MLGHRWIRRISTKFARIRTLKVHPSPIFEMRVDHEGISRDTADALSIHTPWSQLQAMGYERVWGFRMLVIQQ
jgi:hypothetical protein